MTRRLWLWPTFAAFTATVLASMAALTISDLDLSRADLDMRGRERMDAAARTSLWRLDTSIAQLIAADEENSPESRRDQAIGSIPTMGTLDIGPIDHAGSGMIERESADLVPAARAAAARLAMNLDEAPPQANQAFQGSPNAQGDFQQRANNFHAEIMSAQQLNARLADAQKPPAGAPRSLIHPAWLTAQRLGLLRMIEPPHAARQLEVQVVDLPALERLELASIADQLPHATLVRCDDPRDEAYPLASMPLALIPGSLPPDPSHGSDALGVTPVGYVWMGVLCAITSMAALLARTKSLGDRQAAFASAVTHELRTPITSLRLYADMLADGMVPDEEKRCAYLATIRSEAERLGRLVENVLAWARLERTRERTALTANTLGQLVSACHERLARRAAEAGMTLAVDPGADGAAQVLADAGMVEQVLFNLVDNACKYAAASTDRRIEVRAQRRKGHGAIIVLDQGPGIDPAMRQRLFRAFERSASEAARSAPGVGLGLALSRRLARGMGGGLMLERSEGGAAFALELRLA